MDKGVTVGDVHGVSVWASAVKLSPTFWICSSLVLNIHHPLYQESLPTCPLLRPHRHGKTQPVTGRSRGRSTWRFTLVCPASTVRSWIFRWRAFLCRRGDGIAPEGWKSDCDFPDGARQTLHTVATCHGDLGTTASARS